MTIAKLWHTFTGQRARRLIVLKKARTERRLDRLERQCLRCAEHLPPGHPRRQSALEQYFYVRAERQMLVLNYQRGGKAS